ncbi:hypothetical protein [Pseudomonas sp. LS-2]|uniref:hypothetical protein n=1 Tax=Pseudomonas sp. LS-2 TaxID=2315859 RepID=UPI000E73D885|nr:hypothetical protein [Pseudomonas sp. LS-2]RJX83474.1 hypothetical protein D3M70_00145 [Pseudomonas sp. LS-2]
MNDIQKLKALAEAQPEKVWTHSEGELSMMTGSRMYYVSGPEGASDWENWGFTRRAASFIAAANPAAVLELIAEIERLEERNVYWIDQANAIARGRHIARTERDQLKAENEALVIALNDILRVTPMGVEAFGIAALALGELGVSNEDSHD